MCPATQTQYIALQKQHIKKNKEESSEHAQLLAKRMKNENEESQRKMPVEG
jgi:hypothetical protein